MPDFDSDELPTGQTSEAEVDGNAPTAEDFRDLRYKAKLLPKVERKLAERDEENVSLRRELALMKAGLDLTSKQTAALLAAHGDAEMNREALRATAADIGFIQADEPDEQAAERETALQGQARIASAHQGAAAPTPPSNVHEAIRQAETAGDRERATRLKAQQLAALMFNGGTVQIS